MPEAPDSGHVGPGWWSHCQHSVRCGPACGTQGGQLIRHQTSGDRGDQSGCYGGGQRKPSTDLKTSLNDALREYNVAV